MSKCTRCFLGRYCVVCIFVKRGPGSKRRDHGAGHLDPIPFPVPIPTISFSGLDGQTGGK